MDKGIGEVQIGRDRVLILANKTQETLFIEKDNNQSLLSPKHIKNRTNFTAINPSNKPPQLPTNPNLKQSPKANQNASYFPNNIEEAALIARP